MLRSKVTKLLEGTSSAEKRKVSFKLCLLTFALLTLCFPRPTIAGECKFADGSLSELQEDSRFTVSKEVAVVIDPPIYSANRVFFDPYDQTECREAWVTAEVTEKSSGQHFRYFRTNKDQCDGGNTYGIFVTNGAPHAISYIRDGDLTCENPHRPR
jgi:hypothetical protein